MKVYGENAAGTVIFSWKNEKTLFGEDSHGAYQWKVSGIEKCETAESFSQNNKY